MFQFFKPKPVDFIAPFGGKIIKLEDVNDPVFSQKSIGDGYAVEFKKGDVYCPVDGEVIALFPTKHAIGIKAVDRNEYLLHIGLDTVNFNGEGFVEHVKLNDIVKKGQLLLSVDHKFFKDNKVDMTSMVVVTNLRGRQFKMIKDGILAEKEAAVFYIKN